MSSSILGGIPTADKELDDIVNLEPCDNFNLITEGVYRSAFPKKRNFPFLKKLGLKSILYTGYLNYFRTLILEDYPEQNVKFLEENNITLFQFGHRTGCLVGCLRKIQHWSFVSIFEEYRRFSHPKSRSMDQQFIELFDKSQVRVDPKYLPGWPEIENDIFLPLKDENESDKKEK
ncbi:hypothetical protein HDV02_006577 [Globomyces sp. JEL0801]|nr:hypothetical protein HDV02_006577 [Globomyces sp. JEL0801]